MKDIIVAVKLKINHVYSGVGFLYRSDIPLKPGEEVVIYIPDYGASIAMVSEVDEETWKYPDIRDYIVQKVDTSTYMKKRKHQKYLHEMEKTLDKMCKSHETKTLWAALAEKDPEFREVYLTYLQEFEKEM